MFSSKSRNSWPNKKDLSDDCDHDNAQLKRAIEEIEERFVNERKTYARSLEVLNNIVREDEKMHQTIRELEARLTPLYLRVWNQIKCWLKV